MIENIGCYKRDDHREIGKKAVGEEYLAEPAELCCGGHGLAEIRARSRERDRRYLTAGKLDERAAEEVADVDAESRHGKTRDVLIRAQRDGEEAVNKTHEQRTGKRGQQRDHDSIEAVHRRGGAAGLLVEEGPDNAAYTSDIHNAGYAEVEVAGLLGERFAGAAEKKRNALSNCPGNKGNKIKHGSILLCSLAEADLIADKELTADDEEQDDAGEYIGEGLVEGKLRCDLARAAIEQDKQEAREYHDDRVKLCKP